MEAKKLIKLYVDRNYEDLVKAVGLEPLEHWNTVIIDELQTSKNDETLQLLKSIFRGFENNENHLSSIVRSTYIQFINGDFENDNQFANNLICILNHEANQLSSNHIAGVCTEMLDKMCRKNIGDGDWLALFSKLIELVGYHPFIEHEKSGESLTGPQYKTHLIKEICSFVWPSDNLKQIIDMLKEVNFTVQESDVIVEKILEQLSIINIDTLPNYVQQIIDLATSCSKIEDVLKAVLKHFNELDVKVKENEKNDSDEMSGMDWEENLSRFKLSSVEGTTLLFITDTARRNETLSRSLIKLMKNAKESTTKEVVTPFFFSLSLSLTQSSRFYDEAQNLLKNLIYKCITNQHKIKECNWLKQKTSDLPDVKAILFDVVKTCGNGWEHIVGGLVDLGFHLMAGYGPKPGAFGRSFEMEIAKLNSPQQNTCDAGLTVLARTFKMHDFSRGQIISELLKRISLSVNAPAYHYIDLLKAIIKSYPQALFQFNNQIQETVDYLNVLHPHNAKKFLSCLFPLVVINSSLRNSLILVLRKSLFTGQLNYRLSGLRGFLLYLYNFQINKAVSLSQVSSQSTQSIFSSAFSQSSTMSNSQGRTTNHEFLCLELLQVMKRCFNQQPEVRQELYLGLYHVVNKNPRLASFILESLVKQLRKYYEEDSGILPPLQISACISMKKDSVVLLEPLTVLMQSIHYCLHFVVTTQSENELDEDELIDENTVSSIHKIFKSVEDRLIKSDIDDFEIDKASDFSATTKQGQRNCLIVVMAINLYQVMMEYEVIHCEMSSDVANEILQLYQGQKKFYELIASTKTPEIKGKLLIEKLLPSTSIVYIAVMTSYLFDTESVESEEVIDTFNSCESFMKHHMTQTHHMLNHANIHGYFPGVKGLSKQDVFQQVVAVAKSCLHHFMVERNDPCHSPVTFPALQCFHTALLYIKTWQPSKLSDFLNKVCGKDFDQTQSNNDCSTKIIKILQRIVISYISPDASPMSASHKKILPELISFLGSLVSAGGEIYPENTAQQCHEWWRKVCVEFSIDDLNSSKKLLQSHLRSSIQSSSHPEILFRDLCVDIRSEVGSIYEEDEDSNAAIHKIVSQENSSHLLPLLQTFLDEILGDTEWMLQRLRGQLLSGGSGRREVEATDDCDDRMHDMRKKTEDSICSRICTLVVGLMELAQTLFISAGNIDQTVNCFISTFNFLGSFSKYYIWMYAHGIGNISTRFEKLHNFIGDEFMRPVYGFIEHAEKAQTERLDAAKAKMGNKKKGKGEVSISTAMKAKLTKELKEIPKLIFAIEKHEKNLILLGKKAKVDLMKCHHLPVSRDFRIDVGVLRKMDMTKNPDSDEDCNLDCSTDEENVPASKQPRMDDGSDSIVDVMDTKF